jgi:1,4-alpha-glucan branching enzyme
VNYAWGRRDAPPPPRVDIDMLTRESKGAVQQPDREGTVLFRIEAPAAAKVSVVGSFNGWESGATALAKTADGWWAVRIELAPGSYEYAYVIDGEWTTPPEALVTLEDGFGGRNGVLEVLPPEI